MTGVLRKGGNLDTDRGNRATCSQRLELFCQEPGEARRSKETRSSRLFRGSMALPTLGFQPPKLRYNKCLLFEDT